MIPVEYSANNSGGHDWLTDKDWSALEKAGWKVFGFGGFAYKNGETIPDANGLPARISEVPADQQDKKEAWEESLTNSFGGKKHSAYKLFNTIEEALKEFEKLTGQDITDEGCNCCGAPHTFKWGKDTIVRLPQDQLHRQDYNYASGEDLLAYLFPGKDTNLSKREILEANHE